MDSLISNYPRLDIDFDPLSLLAFSHLYSIPFLLIGLNHTTNILLLILHILFILLATWQFVDYIPYVRAHPEYSRKEMNNLVILLLISISEISSTLAFGSVIPFMLVIILNMLLVILHSMIDYHNTTMLYFWYEMSSIKTFGVSLFILYLVVKNPSGNFHYPY
jgi:hypothetical protein